MEKEFKNKKKPEIRGITLKERLEKRRIINHLKEFKLDEKRLPWTINHHGWLYPEENIKEFIKRLKKRFTGMAMIGDVKVMWDEIDKLAGDKLI